MTVSPDQESQLEEANLCRTQPGGSSLLLGLLSYELGSKSQELTCQGFSAIPRTVLMQRGTYKTRFSLAKI